MSEEKNEIEGLNESDKDEYEKICYLCHRPESKVEKMITIPNNITICSDCMQKTFDQIGMQGIADPSKIPGMEFINLADMQMPPQPKSIKKKKK